MAVIYYILLIITDLCGLTLAALTLPGLWLMLAGAAGYAWLTHGNFLSYRTLIVLLVLTVLAEISEIFLGGAGAKKAGASRWGIFGGLIGSVLGGIFLTALIPIPYLGTIIGICMGSFIGAFTIEMLLGQPVSQSALIGYGAAKGKLTGIVSKVGIGLVMFAITLVIAFPKHFGQRSVTISPTTLQVPASAR